MRRHDIITLTNAKGSNELDKMTEHNGDLPFVYQTPSKGEILYVQVCLYACMHVCMYSFIHSFRPFLLHLFKSISTQKRSRHSTDTVPEFPAEAPQATVD